MIRKAPTISAAAIMFIRELLKVSSVNTDPVSLRRLEGRDDEHQRERDEADRLADRDAAVVVLADLDQHEVARRRRTGRRGRR